MHFKYKTLIPTHLGSHCSVKGDFFLRVPTHVWPSLHCSGSSFAQLAVQHDCLRPLFLHPMCQLEVVVVSSFYVAFECCVVFLEVILK
jgi:hypothetical protein